ncbi:MAG: hypothetical protein V1787_00715 [Candidatus Micrarchaeota archaeon]
MRKAFFSFVVIAAVSVALMLLAAYAKSWYDYRNTANYDLEVRLVDQRANDSETFISGMLDDIVVDSAYSTWGCKPSDTGPAGPYSLCTEASNSRMPAYWRAVANLSTAGVTFYNNTEYYFRCGWLSWVNKTAAPKYNYTEYILNLTVNYTVNTSHAAVNHTLLMINKRFDVNSSNMANGKYINITIFNAAFGRAYSYYVDCTV